MDESWEYDDAGKFSDVLAPVKLNGKWGYIDKNMKVVIPFNYDWAGEFTENLALVQSNGSFIYIDKTGKTVISTTYTDAFGFFGGLAVVENNGKFGYIDKTGKEVVACKYEDAFDFSEGLAVVKQNGKYGYIAAADTTSTTPVSKPNTISTTVAGNPVQWTDAEPFIKDGRTLVPLRAVAEALNLTVTWDGKAREAVFTDGTKTIYFPIDSAQARTSTGEKVVMDTSAVISNSRTYAPIRYLAEFFGYTVGWDGTTRTVIIE